MLGFVHVQFPSDKQNILEGVWLKENIECVMTIIHGWMVLLRECSSLKWQQQANRVDFHCVHNAKHGAIF